MLVVVVADVATAGLLHLIVVHVPLPLLLLVAGVQVRQQPCRILLKAHCQEIKLSNQVHINLKSSKSNYKYTVFHSDNITLHFTGLGSGLQFSSNLSRSSNRDLRPYF